MTKILCLVALYLTAVAGFPGNERIINGSPTTIEQYPFVAGILLAYNNVDFINQCGGSIINNRSILTAAHCFIDLPVSGIRSRVGSTLANSGGRVHISARIIPHPEYSIFTLLNDIGIVRVTEAFSFGVNIQVARIAGPGYYPEDNEAVSAVGWGFTVSDGLPSENLLDVQIHIINQGVCENIYGSTVNSKTLCAGGDGYGTCSGDSGGPLVHNNVVVGVVSFGDRPCGFVPTVFARVSSYTDWVQINA